MNIAVVNVVGHVHIYANEEGELSQLNPYDALQCVH